jgi:hypothetical protein
MSKKTTIQLSEDLPSRARRKAAEGRTLGSLIEDGLRAIVSDNPKPAERKRVIPRISKAGAGLMPEVDLTNPRALQEDEDLEYVRRMQRSG